MTRATVVIRPERVAVSPRPGRYRNEVETRIDDLIFLGDHLRVRMTVGGCTDFIAKIPNVVGHGAVLPGDTVTVGWAALDCRALVGRGRSERLRVRDRLRRRRSGTDRSFDSAARPER